MKFSIIKNLFLAGVLILTQRSQSYGQGQVSGSFVVLPQYQNAEARDFFNFEGIRAQQLVEQSALPTSINEGVLLTGISFRPDSRLGTTLPQKNFADFTIQISSSSKSANSMSANLGSNHGPDVKIVASGPRNFLF